MLLSAVPDKEMTTYQHPRHMCRVRRVGCGFLEQIKHESVEADHVVSHSQSIEPWDVLSTEMEDFSEAEI